MLSGRSSLPHRASGCMPHPAVCVFIHCTPLCRKMQGGVHFPFHKRMQMFPMSRSGAPVLFGGTRELFSCKFFRNAHGTERCHRSVFHQNLQYIKPLSLPWAFHKRVKSVFLLYLGGKRYATKAPIGAFPGNGLGLLSPGRCPFFGVKSTKSKPKGFGF